MLRPSAKRVAERARPSGPKSPSTVSASRGVVSAAAANGYSTECVTQSRPRGSNAMFIGFWIVGSAATSWISKPGGRWNAARCSCGGSGSLSTTAGAAAAPAAGSARNAAKVRRSRVMLDIFGTPCMVRYPPRPLSAAVRGRTALLTP